MNNFPEDKLQLLTKPFSFRTRNEFIIHVNMLYEPYIHSKKPPAPKGKVLVTPTKKRIGKYGITYLTKTHTFEFTKTKQLERGAFLLLVTKLEIDPTLLKIFLKKKNFHLHD